MKELYIMLGPILATILFFFILSSGCEEEKKTQDSIVDKHIRELKYEQAQMHLEQNTLIQEKLDGQENSGHQKELRSQDEFPPEGRQEARP